MWKNKCIAGLILASTLPGTGLKVAEANPEKGTAPPKEGVLPAPVKPDEHISGFLEDPFVTKYRRKFFAVFSGNFSEFEQGMKELEAMLAKNPRDARALVWHGNGLMVRAGMRRFTGQVAEGRKLLLDSKRELDRAVTLDSENVNILAMRAVTLHIAGRYWKDSELPPGSWDTIIHDLEKSRAIIRPDRMAKISVHARGEILSELATAYQHKGKVAKARELWNEVVASVPGSSYAAQAKKALTAQAEAMKNISTGEKTGA